MSTDSETVQRTLDPQIPTLSDFTPLHTAEVPTNLPMTYDMDAAMHATSHDEDTTTTSVASQRNTANQPDPSMHAHFHAGAPTTKTPVASQPNTANQSASASAALQQIHNYIDSQLTHLVGVAVEQAIGTRYNELADSINEEISSIKNQVLQDEDDPMSRQDQPHDADGDDESEVDNQLKRDRRNRRPNTKARNRRHNQEQTANDDDDEEDENDSMADHGRRRKGPTVLTVHNYPPQFSHEPTNASIVCPPCVSSTEGSDGKGGVGSSK
jgi:hypothetical protein